MQIYTILSSDGLSKYTFIISETPIRNYRLVNSDNEDIFYAEDNEEGLTFSKKLPKEYNYLEFANLKLFMDLITYFDKNLIDQYDVFERVTVL